MRFLILLLALPCQLRADERHAPFFGTWGTPAQCARDLITPGGSVNHAPFEIDTKWLRHGELWCQLQWGPVEDRNGALFTVANARCGEDTVSGYLLGMTKSDDSLVLRWTLFWKNGPLRRCATS